MIGAIDLTAEVYERRETPGAWAVEAANVQGDGEIYLAVFFGHEAKRRALEYAGAKFATVQES